MVEPAVAAGGSSEGEGAGEALPPLWLCGHFASKPFSTMMDDLKEEHRTVLFWQTKSAVQVSKNDEFCISQNEEFCIKTEDICIRTRNF